MKRYKDLSKDIRKHVISSSAIEGVDPERLDRVLPGRPYNFNTILKEFINDLNHYGCSPNEVRIQAVRLLALTYDTPYSRMYMKEAYKCESCKCMKCIRSKQCQ